MDDGDLDTPPASDDDAVQNFLDTYWRTAVAAVREAREAIQKIHPELDQHLPETASNQLGYTLADLREATQHLHRAGPHILGQDAYDEFIQIQTRRQMGTTP